MKQTLAAALEWAAHYFEDNELFYGHGTDNPWDEAVFLAGHCLNNHNLKEDDLSLELDTATLENFQMLCNRRVNEQVPAAYLTGYMFYAGLKIHVSPDVLVPRSPLASLT